MCVNLYCKIRVISKDGIRNTEGNITDSARNFKLEKYINKKRYIMKDGIRN